MRRILLLLLFLSPQAFSAIALDSTCAVGQDTDNDGDASVAPPSNINDGDVLTFHMMAPDNGTATVAVSGVTEWFYAEQTTGAQSSQWAGYKVAASESGNYDFTWTTVASWGPVYVCVWSGVDTTTPIDVTWVGANHFSAIANDASPAPDAITTVTDGAVVINVIYEITINNDITDLAPSANYTVAGELYGALWRDSMIQYRAIAAAGTETPGDVTPTTADAADDWSVSTIALRPAAGASSVAPQRRRHTKGL